MNILILEDDFPQQKRIQQAVENSGVKDIQDVFVTSYPEKIIQHADKTSEGNVYFLDLEIRGEQRAGFEVAARIREKDRFGVIVFITTHSEMAPVTFEYQVSALDFIVKDLSQSLYEEKVCSCLIKAKEQIQTLRGEFDYFTFQNKHCSFQVPFHEILYFETSEIPHKLRLVTVNKEMEFYADLKEVEGLDERLFRSHRSYIVNIARIRTVQKAEHLIEFDNGYTCLLSRRYAKALQGELNS